MYLRVILRVGVCYFKILVKLFCYLMACYYVVHNQDGHLIPKQNATLRCEVSGITDYRPLFWMRENERITPDGEKYMTDHQNNTLTIIRPSKSILFVFDFYIFYLFYTT